MSKLEVEFALTGLSFKISGERDQVTEAMAKLQQQVASLTQSVASAVNATNGSVKISLPNEPATIEAPQRALPAGKAPKGKRGTSGAKKTTAEAVDFKHDPEKYGYPKQDWNTAQKAMWLLYVLEAQTGTKEASAGVLVATFNKYFKEFGNILAPNVHRDLGATKGKNGQVASDAGKEPQTWYLLSGGKTAMDNLCRSLTSAEAS